MKLSTPSRPRFRDVRVDACPPHGCDLVEPKHDGMYVEVTIRDGHAVGVSRAGRTVLECQTNGCPDCTIVGEYMVGTQRAVHHEYHGDVIAFDLIALAGRSMTTVAFSGRRAALVRLSTESCFPQWMHVTEQYPASQWRKLWDSRVATGEIEGVVFKRSMRRWSEDIYRCKLLQTDDLTCVGFGVSDGGRYDGQVCTIIGQIVVGCSRAAVDYTTETSVPGLTTEQRATITANQTDYIGRRFEIAHNGRTKSGSYRHPRFIRWREHAA